MGGELNRINPTVVEGAEDIFGADERLVAAGSRPGFWSKRGKGKGAKLTPSQFSKLSRMTKMKNRARARAENYGDDEMDAEDTFEARTYRRSPMRTKNPPSKGKRSGRQRRRRRAKRQGYNDKLDESMGMSNGKESSMKQSMKDRRDESKGMEKSMGNRAYSRVMTMDAQGYDDKLDESMGVSNGREKTMAQSLKDRRNESKGMEKSMGKRPYSRVGTMDAETFEANEEAVEQTDANMMNEGSVDAFYGGGRKVAVSGDGITPTANPSVDEAFDVGNDVGIDVSEQEVMNENPSVEVNYGADGIENQNIVSTVQDLTSRVGFRVNGLVASAIVVGIAGLAGYHYAKR